MAPTRQAICFALFRVLRNQQCCFVPPKPAVLCRSIRIHALSIDEWRFLKRSAMDKFWPSLREHFFPGQRTRSRFRARKTGGRVCVFCLFTNRFLSVGRSARFTISSRLALYVCLHVPQDIHDSTTNRRTAGTKVELASE